MSKITKYVIITMFLILFSCRETGTSVELTNEKTLAEIEVENNFKSGSLIDSLTTYGCDDVNYLTTVSEFNELYPNILPEADEDGIILIDVNDFSNFQGCSDIEPSSESDASSNNSIDTSSEINLSSNSDSSSDNNDDIFYIPYRTGIPDFLPVLYPDGYLVYSIDNQPASTYMGIRKLVSSCMTLTIKNCQWSNTDIVRIDDHEGIEIYLYDTFRSGVRPWVQLEFNAGNIVYDSIITQNLDTISIRFRVDAMDDTLNHNIEIFVNKNDGYVYQGQLVTPSVDPTKVGGFGGIIDIALSDIKSTQDNTTALDLLSIDGFLHNITFRVAGQSIEESNFKAGINEVILR